MSPSSVSVRTTLRIPGNWGDPGELIERLPDGFQLTPDWLVTPDGTAIEFTPMPPDDQFPQIFKSSCRRPPSRAELAIVNNYSVNVALSGPGGSLDLARTMLEAGAAIVRAGAGGVFNDNGGLAHGGADWIEMAEDGSDDAISFAFVSIIGGKSEIWTMGMHVLGLHDIVLKQSGDDSTGEKVIDIIRYMSQTDHPIDVGHVIADERGPQFQAMKAEPDKFEPDSPMHNPFGRLRLVPFKDIGLSN